MNIKEIRKKTKLSQSAFASKFGISVRTLQQWEQGKSTPPDYIPFIINRLITLEPGEYKATYHEMMRLPKQSSWKICIDEPFLNCNRVYPIQQKKVSQLLNEMSKNDSVKKIIVFGSSVTNQCHIGSDVDIYAEMSCDENPVKSIYDFEYDFWNNYRVDERLKKEIYKKGVVVYE